MKIDYSTLATILYGIASDEGKTDYTVENFTEWLEEQDRFVRIEEEEEE